MYNITAQMKEKPARDFVYDTKWMPCYDTDFSISRFMLSPWFQNCIFISFILKLDDKISCITRTSIGFIKLLNSIRSAITILDHPCRYLLVSPCMTLISKFTFFSIAIYKYFLSILETGFFLLNDLLADTNAEFVARSSVTLLLSINMVISLEISVLVLRNMYEMKRNPSSCYENS